jgi:type IV secretion system protein VirD4
VGGLDVSPLKTPGQTGPEIHPLAHDQAPMSAFTVSGPTGPQEKSSGRLWRALPLVTAVPLVGCAAATQYLAWRYHGNPALGWNVSGIYPPWDAFFWAHRWAHAYPALYDQAQTIGYSAGLIAAGLVLIGGLARRTKTNTWSQGSARWANKRDLRRSGLLNGSGVYVGACRDGRDQIYLRAGGGEHVLAMAPTGTGKSVGLVIPTLLSWAESAFVLDLKGELWALTSGWRKQHAGNKALRFEPAAAEGSCAFNPLDEIRIGTQYEVGDAQNISLLLVDPDGKGLNDHWSKTAQSLLVGCVLYTCHRARQGGEPATLPALDRLLADPAQAVGKLWEAMKGSAHPVVAAAGRDMLDRPEMEAGSVLSTAKSYLSLYRDPTVARNVSRSDFCIAALMHHESPVSLYVVTEATDKVRLRPLVRILANLVLRRLASGMGFDGGQPKPSYKHQLLLMLDEFPSLGRLAIFEEALAYIRGYGIKAFIVTQDLSQLHAAYGKDESITGNCGVLAAFPPARLETAEHLSRMTGQTTVVREQVTKSGRGFAANLSRTLQESGRPLLTADECMRLPGPVKDGQTRITAPGEMLVFLNGYPAIRGVQPLYFADETFRARAAVPPPLESDALILDPQEPEDDPDPAPVTVPSQEPEEEDWKF